ncbi:hypothetical protein SAMN05216266_10610 [Amycolatopsis marina]|uniref:Uncharacterized protein n=1 Tax=Amycolatopsis marina TaxID=490629 RepID=A0A1I0Z0U4_9PSEU|nr:hypothetical protein [Amycolatopsis marina]SFB19032.1 hypothetical protein SAMN05216266_10610 [Amycolatopsis marina]
MTRTRRNSWAVAVGVLAGAGLVAVGIGVDVLWLVWLGVALALLALCLWPVLSARSGREEPEADPGLEEPSRSPRAVGGEAAPEDADQHSTTAPSANATFVGRVSGADTGAEEVTGAERRSWDRRKRPRS